MPRNRLNSLSQHAAFVSVSSAWEVPRGARSWHGSYTETRRFDQKTVGKGREKVFLVEKEGKKEKVKMGEGGGKLLENCGKKKEREGKSEKREKRGKSVKRWKKGERMSLRERREKGRIGEEKGDDGRLGNPERRGPAARYRRRRWNMPAMSRPHLHEKRPCSNRIEKMLV